MGTILNHLFCDSKIPCLDAEMRAISQHFSKDVLTEVDENEFFKNVSILRENYGDRAVSRAIHFYRENACVPKQVEALEQGDFAAFLKLVKESGYSSYMYLQKYNSYG